MGFLFFVDIFISLKIRSFRGAFVIQKTIVDKFPFQIFLVNDQLLFSLQKVLTLCRITGLLFHKISYLALANEGLDVVEKTDSELRYSL